MDGNKLDSKLQSAKTRDAKPRKNKAFTASCQAYKESDNKNSRITNASIINYRQGSLSYANISNLAESKNYSSNEEINTDRVS